MRNVKPLVSIIIPVYNSEKYIKQTLQSVLEQTYKEYEVLIINDGSMDNSIKIINHFISEDDRFILVNLECNKGVSYARNVGISLAKGEYIAFLDSDDIWVYDKLEKQIKIVTSYENHMFVFTATQYIDENGNNYNYWLKVPKKVTFNELLKQNVISCSSVLINKKLIENIRMPSDKMHEDYALWLTVLKKGVIAYGINEPLLKYRVLRQSKSSNKIKASLMTYMVYKYVDIKFFKRVYYWIIYIKKNIRKYRLIRRE